MGRIHSAVFLSCAIVLGIVYVSRSTLLLTEGNFESYWTPFCEEDIYYKPYVRIKNGRYGQVIKDRGPGILDVAGMQDIYVCANGLVFLYFKITNFWGQVYDDAVMQYASHYCGFFNGKLGPGMTRRNTTLHAILLVGHPEDYRKIALQMFTAPSYNFITKKHGNYTSLAIINTNGECILEKGVELARVRVKANAPSEIASKTYEKDEERHTTICRLDVKTLIKDNDTSAPVPFETELVSREEVVAALEIKEDGYSALKFSGCWQYPLIDKQQLKIIKERMEKSSDESSHIDKAKSELNPQDGEGLSFWTKERLEKYGNPTDEPPQDNATLLAEVESKNSTYLEEVAKPKESQDKEKLKEAKEELQTAVLKLKLFPYLQKYFKYFDATKKYGKYTRKSSTGWGAVYELMKSDEVEEIRSNYIKVQEELSAFYHSLRLNPYDVKLLEMIEQAEKNKTEFYMKLRDKTEEIEPMITKNEVNSARRTSCKAQARRMMEKIQNLILEDELKQKNGKWGKSSAKARADLTDRESFQDMLLSLKNSNEGGGNAETPCLVFTRAIDQCKEIKPTEERVCQIAGNWLSGGKGKDDKKTWREEVFDLLESIFSKACPYFRSGFAQSINGIVKGYLAKQPEGIGLEKNLPISGSPAINSTLQHFISNYKIGTPEDLYPALKEKDSEIWDQILKELQKCEKGVTALKFENIGVRPPKFTFKGKEVPNHVEQGDKEFAFNWAIDMNYRIFSTVLGMCINNLDTALAKKFYDEYHEHILDPIRLIWLNNRDNNIFKVIMGRYHTTGKGDLWTKLCMEASYMHSDRSNMRPIRRILVNSYSEPNYFVEGPMSNTRSSYYLPSKPHATANNTD